MADTPDPLAGLWEATRAPARDLAFELALAERLSRRRLALDAARVIAVGGITGLAGWAAWPGLAPMVEALGSPFVSAGPVIGVVAAVTTVVLWMSLPAPDAER
jgi:hypothetical protein